MKTIFTTLFLLAAILLNAQIFSTKMALSTSPNNPEVIKSFDVNQDGYMDLIYSSINDSKIAYFLFDENTRSFSNEHIISSQYNYVVSLFPADLNGDSYPDILGVSQLDNQVFWFKNNAGNGFSFQAFINENADDASAVTAADLDNDGDFDVISASKGSSRIEWYENDGNGNFSSGHLITQNANLPTTIITADINNDGYDDIIAGYAQSDEIAYFKNIGGGAFASELIIGTQVDIINSLAAADFNKDGFIDIVSASKGDGKIAWIKNIDGGGNFSDQMIISNQMPVAFSVVVADFDLDNDIDVLATSLSGDRIVLFENSDSNGGFVEQQDVSYRVDGPKGIVANDFDNDGDWDIAAAVSIDDDIVWFENGKACFVPHQISDNHIVTSIISGDINNDGQVDVIYSEHGGIYALMNMGSGESFVELPIYEESYNVQTIKLNDLDNDGDLDLIVADWLGDEFYWFKNENGDFGNPIFIDTQSGAPCYLNVSDVDNDGDLDLMIAILDSQQIAVYYNDGSTNFVKTIIASGTYTQSQCFADVNHDSYDDIVFSANDKIYNMLNDGNGSFLSAELINANADAFEMKSDDLNNDGWDDILFTDGAGHWMINNHDGTYTSHVIDPYGAVVALNSADFDNDGDIDMALGARDQDCVYMGKNTGNGQSMLLPPRTNIKGNPEHLAVGDLNNDGYTDIIVGSWPAERVHWAENYQYRIIKMPSDQFVCEGEKAFFSVLSTGVITYQWQLDAGSGFTDISTNSTYVGVHKAQLIISGVDESEYGNHYRCKVYSEAGAMMVTDAATLNPFEASISCVDNQSRMAGSNGMYVVEDNEFDVANIFNKCNENLSISNDYNNSETLAGEILGIGDYTITWTLSNVVGEQVDQCTFDIEILNFVGINEPQLDKFSISPNPSNGCFSIEYSNYQENELYELSITDIRGKRIQEIYLDAPVSIINISGQAAGIYFVKLRTNNGVVLKRVLKR